MCVSFAPRHPALHKRSPAPASHAQPFRYPRPSFPTPPPPGCTAVEASAENAQSAIYSTHASYTYHHADPDAAQYLSGDAPGEITAHRHRLQAIPQLTSITPCKNI